MPGKAKIPQPIDRPLSRAYLRQFKGWSTAYPPGLSDPASLALMENVMVSRDTGLKVRPGLRYISYAEGEPLVLDGYNLVGTHEVFFQDSGEKAYLFAVLYTDYVKFMVAKYLGDGEDPSFDVVPAEDIFDMDPDVIQFTAQTTYVKYLQIDNKIIALSDAGESLLIFYVDTPKRAVKPSSVTYPQWTVANQLEIRHPDNAWVATPTGVFGPAETPSSTTLISSTASANTYNIGLFYTYYNELGESAPSQVKVVKVQRPWSGWLQGPGTEPEYYDDQLIARIQGSPAYFEFNAAITDQGARGAYLYMATWADGDPLPVEALLVDEIEFTDGSAFGTLPYDATEAGNWWNAEGWFRLTASVGLSARTVPMPSLATRRNYTQPSHGGNGIVAADRMVLVNDPTAAATIRWTSSQQGEYLNFSASRGGGVKTLTSGNLMVPACVKLWQNPQSVDTLTILCRGVDGMSTGYYMSPAEVTQQSESTSIMGFEETTASPGTTSPYGCEVFNNALFHPLEDQLMKSTAANYAIRHKSVSDLIANKWVGLEDKDQIVSSEFDGRLYFIVHNPDGVDVDMYEYNGNEIWVLDAAAEAPTWSRWLVPAIALRKVEIDNKVYMSVVKPEGIYILDPDQRYDEYVSAGEIAERPIPWLIETNTQGANRAHDAWAYVQQLELTLGNFQGKMAWGLRGLDINGQRVDLEKITQDLEAPGDRPWDQADYLLVQRTMKEWVFFAHSITDEHGTGQINLVQYRYTPSTVNTGYEFGSVETFEYGRAVATENVGQAPNGVPLPYVDLARP